MVRDQSGRTRPSPDDRLKPGIVMAYPASPYIAERDGGLYIAGARVSLDSVLIRFREGASPDRIVHCFPTLELFQVYGAIAYYLENEEAINGYLEEGERFWESAPRLSETNPALFARLQAARQQLTSKQK
jgi:uncharacterized protein (DUF433 family)